MIPVINLFSFRFHGHHPAPVRLCLYAREHKNMTAGKCRPAGTRFRAPNQSANIFQSDNL
jgi:hypothetical protein